MPYELAATLLWDQETADALSVGCAEHQDPTCLCDVDLSKTAHITYDTPPPEFHDVTTVEELVDAAAEAILRKQVYDYADGCHELRMNVIGTELDKLSDDDLLFLVEEDLYATDRMTRDELSELLDVKDVHLFSFVTIALGTLPLSRQRHSRRRLLAVLRYHDEGLPNNIISQKMEADGFECSPASVEQTLRQLGRKFNSEAHWRRRQLWNAIQPYIGEPYSKQAYIAGCSKAQVVRLHAMAKRGEL